MIFVRAAAWYPRLAIMVVCLALVFAGLALSAPAHAANAMSLADMEKIMWQATEDVLKTRTAQEVAGFRALILGSWVNKTGGSSSDIDITFGHPDPKLERELAEQIKDRITELKKGRSADINVMYKREFLSEEFYRGPVGQKMVYNIANDTAAGTGCVKFSAVTDGAGQTVIQRQRTLTGSYWTDLGDTVPTKLVRPHTFFEDSHYFITDKLKTLSSVDDQAVVVAKYLDRADGLVMPALQSQWRTNLQRLRLNPEDQAIAKILVRNKKITDVAVRQARILEEMKLAGIPVRNTGEMTERLARFVDDGQKHMVKLAEDTQVVDWAVRMNKIKPAGGASKLLATRDKIWSLMKQHGKKLFLAVDAFAVLSAYYDADPSKGPNAGLKAATLEMTTIAIGHACPPALLIAMAAELGRNVFVAVGTWTGRELVFGPINSAALKAAYNPKNVCNVFGLEGTFLGGRQGLNRETLSYHVKNPEQLRVRVRQYVNAAKAYGSRCALYTTAGAGSFEDTLFEQMYKDWRTSQMVGDTVMGISALARAGVTAPPDLPLAIAVNPPHQEVPTGRTGVFHVEILRSFGLTTRMKPGTMDLYDAWGKLGGREAMQKYQDENIEQFFDTGMTHLDVTVNVRGAKGWKASSNLPVPMPALDAAGNGSSKGKLEIINLSKLPQVLKRFKLGLTPASDKASGRAVIMVNLVWHPMESSFQPRAFTFAVTATHKKKSDDDKAPEDKLNSFRFRNVKASWTDEGWLIQGSITVTNLNPPGAFPEREDIMVVAEVAKGPGASYPVLPTHVTLRPSPGMSGLMRGGRQLTNAQVRGSNIASFVFLNYTPRAVPVWRAYGGYKKFRENAPNTVTANFKGVIPREYAGHAFRLRGSLRQEVGGPNAAWESVGFRHQLLGKGKIPLPKPKDQADGQGRWGGMLKLWDTVMDVALEFWEGLEFELARPGTMSLPDGTVILAPEGDLSFAVTQVTDTPGEYSYEMRLDRGEGMATILVENKDRKVEIFDMTELGDDSVRLPHGATVNPVTAREAPLSGGERYKASYLRKGESWTRKKGVFTGDSGRLSYGAPHALGIHGSGGYNLMGNKHPNMAGTSPAPLPRDMKITTDQTYVVGPTGALRVDGSQGMVVTFSPEQTLVINRAGKVRGWTAVGTAVSVDKGNIGCFGPDGLRRQAGLGQIRNAALSGCPKVSQVVDFNPSLWVANKEGRQNAVEITATGICVWKDQMGSWTQATKPPRSQWPWPVAAAVKHRPGELTGDYQVSFQFSTKRDRNNEFYVYRDGMIELTLVQGNRLRWRDPGSGGSYAYASAPLAKGRWYNIKLTCRPLAGAVDIHINGKAVGKSRGIKPGQYEPEYKDLIVLGSRGRIGLGQGCWRQMAMLPLGAEKPPTPITTTGGPEGGTTGSLEAVGCPNATGWARDPLDARPVWVEAWSGGPIKAGKQAVSGWADADKKNLPFGDRKHGFGLKLPSGLKVGQKIYAYAKDPFTENPVLLSGSPQVLRCNTQDKPPANAIDKADCEAVSGQAPQGKAWIELYIDGYRQDGRKIYAGWTGDQGAYSVATPQALKDDRPHALRIYAFDQPGGQAMRLMGWEKRVDIRCGEQHPPEGWLGRADCTMLRGWARDPDDPRPVRLGLSAKAPDGKGIVLFRGEAAMPRPDLPYPDKNHGFQLATPAQLKDGRAWKVYAQVYDTWNNQMVLLKGSGQTLQCQPGGVTAKNHPPEGAVLSVGCDGVYGWARDPDSNLPLVVAVVEGKPLGQGRSMGKTTANQNFDGLPASARGRGFHLELPDTLKDGEDHRVYAYALDAVTTSPTLLGGRPITFRCAQEPPQPPAGGDLECPRVRAKEAYQIYIRDYNRLTYLMSQGKGDTPEAQAAYKAYRRSKDCYERSQRTGGSGAGQSSTKEGGVLHHSGDDD